MGHIERFGRIRGIPAPQREQILNGYAQLLLRVAAQVLVNQFRGEAVEARGNSATSKG